MENRNYRGEWAGCSHLKERREELLKAHEEFQKLLENGFKLKEAKVKRPRIQKEKAPRKVVISVLDHKTTVTYQEYLSKCQGFRIIMEIF